MGTEKWGLLWTTPSKNLSVRRGVEVLLLVDYLKKWYSSKTYDKVRLVGKWFIWK